MENKKLLYPELKIDELDLYVALIVEDYRKKILPNLVKVEDKRALFILKSKVNALRGCAVSTFWQHYKLDWVTSFLKINKLDLTRKNIISIAGIMFKDKIDNNLIAKIEHKPTAPKDKEFDFAKEYLTEEQLIIDEQIDIQLCSRVIYRSAILGLLRVDFDLMKISYHTEKEMIDFTINTRDNLIKVLEDYLPNLTKTKDRNEKVKLLNKLEKTMNKNDQPQKPKLNKI